MAFLFEEDRGLTYTKDPYPHLGPGVYQIPEHQTKTAYAPFLSTGKRQGEMTNKQKAKFPGPGQYEVQLNMGDSGVQAYMNKSTIIVKVQGRVKYQNIVIIMEVVVLRVEQRDFKMIKMLKKFLVLVIMILQIITLKINKRAQYKIKNQTILEIKI